MTLVIFTATVTMLLFLGIPAIAARFGPDVAGRFLEKGAPYTDAHLRAWIAANPGVARRYAMPVLIPLDLVFAAALAWFTAAGSCELARAFGWGDTARLAVLVLPAAYFVTDLIEDVALATMLTTPACVTTGIVGATRAVTRLKLVTATGALLQTLGFALASLVGGQS
jgi:hypothetical protein